MKTYTLTQRDIPLDDTWDVIVVGGEPAGCTAATAAVREGSRTLQIVHV
jgi:tRNA U34 5-carboxymethylaminomethyl modifying enzyme MnmG/GidA